MLAHDNLLQAEKTLENAKAILGKANSFISRGISLDVATQTNPDDDAGGWGSSGATGVWGSGGSSGYSFGGVAGYIAMATNSINLALAALHYYPDQPA